MYQFSRDYSRLFDLICDGQVIAGWVDYGTKHGMNPPLRDVVKIERRAPFDIYIGVRGICYTDLGAHDREKGQEREVFTERCKSVNLEWIECGLPRAEVAAAMAALRAEFLRRTEPGANCEPS